jgi:hypothetical protein
MSGLNLSGAPWRKSSRSSGQGGNCVEVAVIDGVVKVRHSRDPNGPVLTFTPGEWQAFVAGVKSDEFDLR